MFAGAGRRGNRPPFDDPPCESRMIKPQIYFNDNLFFDICSYLLPGGSRLYPHDLAAMHARWQVIGHASPPCCTRPPKHAVRARTKYLVLSTLATSHHISPLFKIAAARCRNARCDSVSACHAYRPSHDGFRCCKCADGAGAGVATASVPSRQSDMPR